MIRSATFVIGLLLALGAFAAFFLLGSVLNPPPYQVIVAMQDIPAYSTLGEDALAADPQTMSPRVAADLVTRSELNQYLGGFVLETIHAGEPLRKAAIGAPNNPQAISRLALILNDPNHVAMVIPVDAKTSPEQIQSGDIVDVVLSLAPNSINNTSDRNLSALLVTPTPAGPLNAQVPVTVTARNPIGGLATLTQTITGTLSAEQMNLPVVKVTLQRIPILAVRRERVANPNFAVAPAVGETRSNQPAYIAGDIQAVVARVPRASAELLTFAIDNGRVHLSLLSPQLANQVEDSPTLGTSWSDVIAWMLAERRRAAGEVVAVSPNGASTTTPTATTPQATITATPTRVAALRTPVPNNSSALPNVAGAADLLGNLTCIVVPLLIGLLIVIGSVFVMRRLRA